MVTGEFNVLLMMPACQQNDYDQQLHFFRCLDQKVSEFDTFSVQEEDLTVRVKLTHRNTRGTNSMYTTVHSRGRTVYRRRKPRTIAVCMQPKHKQSRGRRSPRMSPSSNFTVMSARRYRRFLPLSLILSCFCFDGIDSRTAQTKPKKDAVCALLT